ncbi:MAG TPA: MqnA/MqnD/SBP family protein, partial [Planctomycetota bacterium]|nr:MqnA/MqnD/SBP family protein [Planctomycetota bacterium]
MKPLQIGSVPYLNAWPLIWPLLEARSAGEVKLVLAEPRLLRKKLRSGEVDAALLSSVEVLADRRRFSFAPGFGV